MKVRYSSRARDDINRIHDYIAAHNPRAATAVVRQIRTTCRLLGRHPGLGRQTQLADVRVISTARYPYLVYHHVDANAVMIVHVRDARRDVPSVEDVS
jgi:plasmid stabilization system protein ParE